MAQPRFQLIPGGRLAHASVSAGGGVGWRLLGANNRELGRSAVSYADAEDALAALGRVRRLAHLGDAHVVHDQVTGLWAWHLDDDGVLVATSGRGFRHAWPFDGLAAETWLPHFNRRCRPRREEL